MRAAFRELRVPLTLEQVKAYLKKADVLRNNRITYEEFMWSVERADTEMQMLMDAGASQSRCEGGKRASPPGYGQEVGDMVNSTLILPYVMYVPTRRVSSCSTD